MQRGQKFLAATALLSLAGCGGGPELQLRSTPAPVSATSRPVPVRIAEAHGNFLLGNIALALESYRKALRDDPRNVDAMVGMAACYDKMARFDLSRRYYESALAVMPTDVTILRAFAASLDVQNLVTEARSLRNEAATILRSQAPSVITKVEPSRQALAPAAPLGTVNTDHTLTVALAPARPAETSDSERPTANARSEVGRTAANGPSTKEAKSVADRDADLRLERLSLAEVALVTNNGPRWKPHVVTRTGQSTTVRFVPLKREERSTALRLLNAARTHRLAARTRVLLRARGWQRIDIGDAGRTRDRSLVLYSSGTEQAARRLAAQFGFSIAREPRPGGLTVLLGRDAVGLAPPRH